MVVWGCRTIGPLPPHIMEPTPEKIAGFASLQDVAAWAGLDGEEGDLTVPQGSLFDLLGVRGSQPVVCVARIQQIALRGPGQGVVDRHQGAACLRQAG